MTATERATPLPRRKSYGPFVRIIQPNRHIYQTTIDYRRWLLVFAAAGGVALVVWAIRGSWRYRTDIIFQIFGAFMVLVGVTFLGLVYMLLVYRTRLGITPRDIVLEKRGYSGRTSRRAWEVYALERVAVGDLPTFHIGGSTPTYPIYLSFADGEEQNLFATFDELRPAEQMAKDIASSVELLAEVTPIRRE